MVTIDSFNLDLSLFETFLNKCETNIFYIQAYFSIFTINFQFCMTFLWIITHVSEGGLMFSSDQKLTECGCVVCIHSRLDIVPLVNPWRF